MESQKERLHREAIEACKHRAEVVEKAISKLIAYIEKHPENPAFLTTTQRRFELISPLVSARQDQIP
ncbi:MAG: hypothetical protein ACJ72Z_13495 [Pyrinomonadaceae bacterium]